MIDVVIAVPYVLAVLVYLAFSVYVVKREGRRAIPELIIVFVVLCAFAFACFVTFFSGKEF